MKHINRKLTSRQKGVAMIETALTLPLILLVLFGIFNFGFALYNKAVITNASREAARAGIVYTENVDDIEGYAESIASDYCVGRLINFGGDNTCDATAQLDVDNNLVVTVSFDFNSIAGGLVGLAKTMSMSSVTTMKSEV